MRIAILGCCKQKREKPGPAQDVYCSYHFRTAMVWSRRFTDRVLIASSKLGLIHPTDVIAPYNYSFSRSPAAKAPTRISEAERMEWGRRVVVCLLEETSPEDELVFVCGKSYWSVIVAALPDERRYSMPFRTCKLATRTARMRKELGAR